MEFIVLLLVFAVCYCLYEIYENKKMQKKPTTLEEENHCLLMYKKLNDLKNKECELSFKNEMINQSLKFNIRGVVEEFDEEWVHLSDDKSKKEEGHLIRIMMIQDVKEII